MEIANKNRTTKIICNHCTKMVQSKGLTRHHKTKKCLDSRNIENKLADIENSNITEENLLEMLANFMKEKLIKKGSYTEDQLALIELLFS